MIKDRDKNPDTRFDISLEEYALWTSMDPDYFKLQEAAAMTAKNILGNLSTSTVMDLGVGCGATAQAILNELPRVFLVGVDNNSQFLAKAKETLGKEVVLLNRDLLEALSDEWVQNMMMITSVLTIHNLSLKYRIQLFPAIFSALQPGGVLFIADKIAEDDICIHDANYIKWLDTLLPLREINEKLYTYAVQHERDDCNNRLTEGALRQHLACNGFTDINMKRHTGEHNMHVVASARKPR